MGRWLALPRVQWWYLTKTIPFCIANWWPKSRTNPTTTPHSRHCPDPARRQKRRAPSRCPFSFSSRRVLREKHIHRRIDHLLLYLRRQRWLPHGDLRPEGKGLDQRLQLVGGKGRIDGLQ